MPQTPPQSPPVQAVEPLRNGNGAPKASRRRRWRGQRDWGGLVARLLCALFAFVGIVPLALGALVRMDRVQNWAAERTSQLLHGELGLEASYDLELRPWPLEVSMTNVELAASDGGSPFLRARSVVARPRIFSLLAGKIDFGEVDIDEPELRAVIRDGELVNLRYTLPESDGGGEELPLSSVSLTNARVEVTIDDAVVRSQEIDVDLVLDRSGEGEAGSLPPFEVAARAGRTELDRRHPDPAGGGERADEDVVCRLALRARVAPDGLLLRRLDVEGAADLDPAAGTRPGCELSEGDWRRVSLSVATTEARFGKDGRPERLDGRVQLRAPVPLVHRFVEVGPTTGWVALDLESIRLERGERLPSARGKLRAAELGIDAKVIAHRIEAELETRADAIELRGLRVGWAGGDARIGSATVRPFDEGIPLDAQDVVVDGVSLTDLLDDINVHPSAHVTWTLVHTEVKRFSGTLDPVALSGKMTNETRDFAIYDRSARDPDKRLLMGVPRGNLAGTFKVTPEGVVMSGFTVDTGRSRVLTTVSIEFDEDFGLTVYEGTTLDLADISPVVDIPIGGKATVVASGHGTFDNPVFEGDISIDGFELGGFPLGNVTHGKAHFVPLVLSVADARLVHGESAIDVSEISLDFDDGDADLVLRGRGDTRRSGLRMADFYEMVRLDDDPRWKDIDGILRGSAEASFVLGGKRDRCGGGRLEVQTSMELSAVRLFGESFDSGSMEMSYLWDDIDAGDRGIVVDLHSGVLRKGSGTVLARASIRHDAALQADVTASGVPLDRITAFQGVFGASREDDPEQRVRPEADVSLVATIGGSLHRLEGQADIDVSPMRIGPDVLPPSRFRVAMIPMRPAPKAARTTRCGNPVVSDAPPEEGDPVESVLALEGQLFDGQVRFDDLEITEQRARMVSGTLQLQDLDLGAFANLLPGVAFSAEPPRGRLSASVHIDELPVDEPGLAEVRIFLQELEVTRAGTGAHVGAVAEPLLLSGDVLRIPRMPVELRFPSGLKATLVSGGSISNLSQPSPRLGLSMQLPPVDLSRIGVDIPQIERAAGEVRAAIELEGTVQQPRLSGWVTLDDGQLRVEGFPLPLDDIEVDLRISPTEIRIRRARARAGNTGLLSLSGRLPLRGLELAGGSATLVARDVKIPMAEGVKLTADATLHASYERAPKGASRNLPNVTGTVSLTQFSYTRPMSFTLDLDQITGRGRTEVETYNPEDELFNFDVMVVSPRPLRITNNLVDMRLDISPPGLQVSGTNERYGARGGLRIQRNSKVYLQGHDFRVDDGTVTFDNATRIAPRLDVHATTEYQRYASSTDIDATGAGAAADATSQGTSASTGGRWRIAMHAFGDLDSPTVRFTSDPPLSQDDIVLLLQVGMTRAELDRGLAGFAGVGLETLTTFGGVNEAVQKSLPLFDDVHVGSQYSSRSGRPEPTLTVGKRITDDVRATVSTGLSETREVRSTVEWQLEKGVSVQGRYDNVDDVSSSTVGNVGADLRWRLEFE